MFEEIQINANVFGIVQQRQRMITKWLDYDLNALWSKLADALEVAKEIFEINMYMATEVHSLEALEVYTYHVSYMAQCWLQLDKCL